VCRSRPGAGSQPRRIVDSLGGSYVNFLIVNDGCCAELDDPQDEQQRHAGEKLIPDGG